MAVTDSTMSKGAATSGERTERFDLADPRHIRAEMARIGLAPTQLSPYEDPERGYVDPLDDSSARSVVRGFLAAVWRACERAEWHAAEAATVASDIGVEADHG